jgi:hypothetical protein
MIDGSHIQWAITGIEIAYHDNSEDGEEYRENTNNEHKG